MANKKLTLPYESATSGTKAREEILKILQRFGCQSVGFMDEFETKTLILAFTYNNVNVQLKASAQGWANAYLKQKPHTRYMRKTRQQYEERALNQGMIAVNSILRDWVKGQMTAVDTGILTFEHVFMPYMLMNDGRRLADMALELIPALGHDDVK